jgi:hypothetical protein
MRWVAIRSTEAISELRFAFYTALRDQDGPDTVDQVQPLLPRSVPRSKREMVFVGVFFGLAV